MFSKAKQVCHASVRQGTDKSVDGQARSQNPAILIPVSFEIATNLRAEVKQSLFRQNLLV